MKKPSLIKRFFSFLLRLCVVLVLMAAIAVGSFEGVTYYLTGSFTSVKKAVKEEPAKAEPVKAEKAEPAKTAKTEKTEQKRHGTEKSVSFFASGGSRNENQTGNLADTSYKMQKRRTETNTYDEKLLKI